MTEVSFLGRTLVAVAAAAGVHKVQLALLGCLLISCQSAICGFRKGQLYSTHRSRHREFASPANVSAAQRKVRLPFAALCIACHVGANAVSSRL